MEKTIPGAPENEVPVHLRKKQVCAKVDLCYVEKELLTMSCDRSTPTASLGNECDVQYCWSRNNTSATIAAVNMSLFHMFPSIHAIQRLGHYHHASQ